MSTTAARLSCSFDSPSLQPSIFSLGAGGFSKPSDSCQQEDKEIHLKLQSCIVIA